MLKLIIK